MGILSRLAALAAATRLLYDEFSEEVVRAMGIDYIVIQAVRQRFRDSPGGTLHDAGRDRDEYPKAQDDASVGTVKDSSFGYADADGAEFATLQFNALDVSAKDSEIDLLINGTSIPGNIPQGPQDPNHVPRPPRWT